MLIFLDVNKEEVLSTLMFLISSWNIRLFPNRWIIIVTTFIYYFVAAKIEIIKEMTYPYHLISCVIVLYSASTFDWATTLCLFIMARHREQFLKVFTLCFYVSCGNYSRLKQLICPLVGSLIVNTNSQEIGKWIVHLRMEDKFPCSSM